MESVSIALTFELLFGPGGGLGDLDTVGRAEVFSRDQLEQNKGGDKTGFLGLDFLKRVFGSKV